MPLQDSRAAARELEREVSSLGLNGVLINGYSNVGDNEQVRYLDEAPLEEFWECVSRLDVPIYLHSHARKRPVASRPLRNPDDSSIISSLKAIEPDEQAPWGLRRK